MDKIKFILYIVTLVLFSLYIKDRMFMTAFATRSVDDVYTISSIVILALDCILALLYIINRVKFRPWGRKILYFLIYTLFISLCFHDGSKLGILLYGLPLLTYLGFNSISRTIDKKWFMLPFFVFSLTVMYFFFEIHTLIQVLVNEDFVTNIVLSVVYLLPMLFCMHKSDHGKLSYLKWIYLILTIVAILYSSKRAPFISVFGALFIFYYINKVELGRNNSTKLLRIFGVVLVVYVGLNLFLSRSDLYIVERLTSIQFDKGSGRTEVWGMVLKIIQRSDLFHLIIGHGTDSLSKAPGNYMGYPAHNDFLECIYDYGLIGFVLYISIHVAIIKETLTLVKERSKYAASMAMSYVMFFISSMVSQIIIYEYYLVMYCMFWAYINTSRQKEIEDLNKILKK